MDIFELLTEAIQINGIPKLSKLLNVNKGTIKRWIELNKVPEYYLLDLKKILGIKIDVSLLTHKEKDQFYTSKNTAKYCLDVFNKKLKELGIDVNEYTYIEPSVGDGSFFNILPPNKRIGIDIETNLESVIVSDYLDWNPDESLKKMIVLGNPPFGLRGNLALKFINHSKYADFIGFILPQIFESDGKGSCKGRVKDFNLIHSEIISPDFYSPDGREIKVNVVFQIWSKYFKNDEVKKTCNNFIKLYSVSDGGTVSSTRNKKMIGKCDYYLPITCFGENKMKLYDKFDDLPQSAGYGIVILNKNKPVKELILNTNWANVSFKSTNGALNLRFDLINKVLTDNGFIDDEPLNKFFQ